MDCSEKSRWRRCANGIFGYRRQVRNAARNLYRRSIKKVLAGGAVSRCRKQRAKNRNPARCLQRFSSLGIQFCQSGFDYGKLIFQQSDRLGGIDATIRSSLEISCQPPTVFVQLIKRFAVTQANIAILR
jgi:hypothetical protein